MRFDTSGSPSILIIVHLCVLRFQSNYWTATLLTCTDRNIYEANRFRSSVPTISFKCDTMDNLIHSGCIQKR